MLSMEFPSHWRTTSPGLIIGAVVWDVVINITLCADLSAAGRSDRLEDTVDYKKIKREVMAEVEASRCRLVEHLAERIAAVCLKDRRVRRVRVLLEKPGALRFARTVGVELERGRKGR
jgi:dihydroneopterin aldolase/D-erythro-7,8-dihydroneopterin triphosphate epimerase